MKNHLHDQKICACWEQGTPIRLIAAEKKRKEISNVPTQFRIATGRYI
jgi:hypothetical protein